MSPPRVPSAWLSAAPAAAHRRLAPACSGSTPSSESPQMPSRTIASATPTSSPSSLGDPGAAGVRVAEMRDAQAPWPGSSLGLVLGRSRGASPPGAVRQASAASTSVGAQRTDAEDRRASRGVVKDRFVPFLARHGRPEAEAVARPHGASAARSTRSARRRSTRARTCHSPRRPHRVCPVCGSYRGREVVTPHARARPRSRPLAPARSR